jgi:hypothetical protein
LKLSLLSPLKDCVSTNKNFHNGLAWQLVLFIYRAGAMELPSKNRTPPS